MKLQLSLVRSYLACACVLTLGTASAESTLCTEITPAIAPVTITAPGVYCLASSVEPVGEFGLRKLAKHVI